MSLSRKSQAAIDLTSKLEAKIRARTHIRLDAPNTKPGDPDNGHVLIVDEKHQKFNGQTYHRNKNGYYVANMYVGKKRTLRFLHVNVWEFHNGPKSEEFVIHHEHKDEHGQWDTSCNDIEYLLLMTLTEHKAWHAKYNPPIELECEICHQLFPAKSKTARYCPKCFKEVCRQINRASRNRRAKAFQTFEESSTALTVVEDDIPRTKKEGAKTIRYCYFCKRPFETLINELQVACNRPDCQGREVARIYEQAKAFALREKIEHNGGFLKFISSKLKKHIRCLLIDGEPWFVAKDAAEALGYKNTRDAISKHVDNEDKDVAKCDTLGGFQDVSIINESGLYALIFGSELSSAKEFKRWVTKVVLPSLRKFGQFTITEETAPPPLLPADTALVLVDADDRPLIP